jgi:hypothetical protein
MLRARFRHFARRRDGLEQTRGRDIDSPTCARMKAIISASRVVAWPKMLHTRRQLDLRLYSSVWLRMSASCSE